MGIFQPAMLVFTGVGGGSRYCLFLPLPGEMIQFDEHFSQLGCYSHHLDIFFIQNGMNK